MKATKNIVIVGFIVLVAYYFAGHDYLRFLLGGKSAMLEVAAQINDLCNTDGSCPTTLEGWQAAPGESVMLSRDNMLYFASPGEGRDASVGNKKYPAFRLVYRFFLPDHWFEARGGTNQAVTSGWESR